MDKTIIGAHLSMAIVYSEELMGEIIILGGYDGSCPKIAYKSRPNIPGGNSVKSEKDKVPREVLIRELTEELSINFNDKKSAWAPKEDVLKIKYDIISNIVPYSDFLYEAKYLEGAIKENITAIYSIFISKVSRETAELVRLHFKNDRKMTTEGFIGIYSLKSLALAEEYSATNATGRILSEYFKTEIPCPNAIKLTKLSSVR